jgi:hypothetical protein
MLADLAFMIALVAALGVGAWSALAGAVLAIVAPIERVIGVAASLGGLALFTGSACVLIEQLRP